MKARLLIDAKCTLAEGPVWVDGAFWWTDIEGRKLHCWKDGELESFDQPDRVGTLVPTCDGRWILACDSGFHFWTPEAGRTPIQDPEPGDASRFNDGKASPQGELFAGTMTLKEPRDAGGFYRLDPDRRVKKLLDGIRCSNGLAWSRDARTLWYIDTPTGRVDALDHDPATGDLSNRRSAVEGFPGHPDGMCVDADDKLWVCQWGGSCIVRCDPRTGTHLDRVELDVPNVTSCCFGGDDLRHLYITTAGGGDPAGAGGIWILEDAGVAGLPVDRYRVSE
jgi:sugar lactone lactonase YvrE